MVYRLAYLILAGVLVACSAPSQTDAPTPQSSEPSSANADGTEPTATTVALEDATGSDAESLSSVSPIRPYDEDPTSTTTNEVSTSAYISRISMSADLIEMKWSASDGAVEYQIHRLRRDSNDQPGPEAMTAQNMIHVVADNQGDFADDDVEAGTPYWYGVRAVDANGLMVAHGWHRAAAVNDDEPPALVGDLTAVVENGEVLITWTQPEENYELHGYQILRSIDGGEPESMATTWRIEQTSFVDDRPPAAGTATYSIVAFDFHWNDSAPAEIDIDLSR